jgi:hypothetical protein
MDQDHIARSDLSGHEVTLPRLLPDLKGLLDSRGTDR